MTPTWCVACDDRHVTGNGVVCDFCLHAEAKALAASPRGEHGTAGGARDVATAGASAVHEGRTG